MTLRGATTAALLATGGYGLASLFSLLSGFLPLSTLWDPNVMERAAETVAGSGLFGDQEVSADVLFRWHVSDFLGGVHGCLVTAAMTMFLFTLRKDLDPNEQ